ncbi:MAG: GNAT family N-acetyltransferase, partial [Myxococcota bacterium]
DIQHEQTDTKGAFFITHEGERAAEMTYSRAGETMIIVDHTGVTPALAGTGAGLKLLRAVVDWAREHKVKVMATCPFARAQFSKYPELQDVYAG